MQYNYKSNIWVFDTYTKNVYKNGKKVWHDDENQIGDVDYYVDFKDWVEENNENFTNA